LELRLLCLESVVKVAKYEVKKSWWLLLIFVFAISISFLFFYTIELSVNNEEHVITGFSIENLNEHMGNEEVKSFRGKLISYENVDGYGICTIQDSEGYSIAFVNDDCQYFMIGDNITVNGTLKNFD